MGSVSASVCASLSTAMTCSGVMPSLRFKNMTRKPSSGTRMRVMVATDAAFTFFSLPGFFFDGTLILVSSWSMVMHTVISSCPLRYVAHAFARSSLVASDMYTAARSSCSHNTAQEHTMCESVRRGVALEQRQA